MAQIEVRNLTKRFGSVTAVDDLSFDATAGRVTGFLGPNGAGKSTTLRALLGLVRATSGSATFGGQPYEALEHPSRRVGVVLEDTAFHPGRTARNHLRVLAAAGQHSASRVDEVLDEVAIAADADRRVKGYSLGMRQRLAIAAALLGDPEVLVLDEPANGLDPPGIRWLRNLMREQARRGRAVLVSSHLLAEVAQSVDDVVVIARGAVRGSGTLDEVLGGGEGEAAIVARAVDPDGLRAELERRGHRVEREGDRLIVLGVDERAVGEAAAATGTVVLELAARERSLEAAFFALTGDEA